MERFVCVNGSDNLLIPESLTQALNIVQPEQLHMDGTAIARICSSMERSNWVRLPFCNTLCAEALGCKPVLSLSGARVKDAPYQKVEQLPEIFQPDTRRMEAVFQAMDLLTGEGKQISYNVEGPFTLLCMLLPMNRVFSALRKPAGQAMLEKAENWVSKNVTLAVEKGCRCISFADPVATVDILGEKLFTSVYLPGLKRILTRLQEEHPDIPIHLCGKLTQCLLDLDSCEAEKWYPEDVQRYGQALTAFCDSGRGGLVGHFCLNFLDAKRPYLTMIKLK